MNRVFLDPAMTLAALDRLVYHATVVEMNVESHRRRAAIDGKQHGAGRPAKVATIKKYRRVAPRKSTHDIDLASDNQTHQNVITAVSASRSDRR